MNQLLMIQYQVIRNDTTKQEIKGLENIYILGSISEEYCLSHNDIRNNFQLYHNCFNLLSLNPFTANTIIPCI